MKEMLTLKQIAKLLKEQSDLRVEASMKEWDEKGHTNKFDQLDSDREQLLEAYEVVNTQAVLPAQCK